MTPRTILITGCSSGIGLASARVMKARGWRVLATARKPEDLARLEKEEGVESLVLELADPASVAACAEEALRRTAGRPYALFNNAAFGQSARSRISRPMSCAASSRPISWVCTS